MVYKAKSNQSATQSEQPEIATPAQVYVKKEVIVPKVVFQPIPATLSTDFKGLLQEMGIAPET